MEEQHVPVPDKRDSSREAHASALPLEMHTQPLSGAKRKRADDGSSTILIDRTQIPTVPLQESFAGDTLNNLTEMGVSAYRPEEVEQNVIEQVLINLHAV